VSVRHLVEHSLDGLEFYKCPSIPLTVHRCLKSQSTMARSKNTRPRFACDRPGCTATCQRKGDMARHKNEKHNGQKYFCPVPGCKHRGAVRRDRYKQHSLKHHPDLYDGESLNSILLSLVAHCSRTVDLVVPTNDSRWDSEPPPFESQLTFHAQAFGKW